MRPLPNEPGHTDPTGDAIACRELWFRYEKDGPDVVGGLSLAVRQGELLALLGGNGTGKTTLLKLVAGLEQPDRGTVRVSGTLGVLPQAPQALFVKKTVREDLLEFCPDEAKAAQVAALCRLDDLLDRHPFDLSGGEQQRAALAKLLLLDPEVLLLDEPTKGLDAGFKQVLAQILRSLSDQGVTILMVSHDIEFAPPMPTAAPSCLTAPLSRKERPGPFSRATPSTLPPPTAWAAMRPPAPLHRRT